MNSGSPETLQSSFGCCMLCLQSCYHRRRSASVALQFYWTLDIVAQGMVHAKFASRVCEASSNW